MGDNPTWNGSIALSAGTTLDFAGGSTTYSGSASITGPITAQMTVTGATVTLAPGMTYGLNVLQVSSGSLVPNDSFSIPTVSVTGSGQFNGSGNLTVTSSLTASAGSSITLGGTGSITMGPGATATLDTDQRRSPCHGPCPSPEGSPPPPSPWPGTSP